MKILYLRTTSFQCDPHVGSILQYAEELPHIEVMVKDYFVGDPNTQILDWVTIFKPDHVVWLGVCGSVHQPTPVTFTMIREKGIKTVMLCPEASHPDWDRVIKEFRLAGSFDLIVNLDGNTNWDSGHNGLTTLAIYDQRPFKKTPPLADRPNDVGFCGGIGFAGTMRQKLIDHFKSVTKFKFVELPFKDVSGTYQQYADFMMSCKIIINPAGSSNDAFKHVKGRVVEAGLAGCALVEEEGSPIDKWFSPGTHLNFSLPHNAEMAVLDLLNDSDMAQSMAIKLFVEVRKRYSPYKLWGQIFRWLV